MSNGAAIPALALALALTLASLASSLPADASASKAAAAAPKAAAPVKVAGEEADAGDLMRLLGVHAWKWRVRGGPVRGVRAEVYHYVRDAHGFRTRHGFGGVGGGSSRARGGGQQVAFLWREQGASVTTQLSAGGATLGPHRFPRGLFAGYVRHGGGAGGAGLDAGGGEYILLAKYRRPGVSSGRKQDMDAYVSLKIHTRR